MTTHTLHSKSVCSAATPASTRKKRGIPVFAPNDFETPCPDNAHGTALADQETAELPPRAQPSRNPDPSAAPTYRPGGDPSTLHSAHGHAAAAPRLRELGVRGLVRASLLDMQGIALAQGRADDAAEVARGALAFLRDYDRKLPTRNGSEDELCELGAAVELLLRAWDEHESSRDCEDVAAAVALVREQWERSFLPDEVRQALKDREPAVQS